MTSETLALEAVDHSGRRLRIEFAWHGDRFGHSVSMGQPAERLLESIEGSSGEIWPASPPFQSLRAETLADGRRVGLLVGMAGQSYWSASVEPVSGEAAILFDVACRTTGDIAGLGSRYRAVSGGRSELIRAVPQPIDGELPLVEADAGGSIIIRPRMGKAKAATIRWKYWLQLNAPAE